jgi:hypothetical protein
MTLTAHLELDPYFILVVGESLLAVDYAVDFMWLPLNRDCEAIVHQYIASGTHFGPIIRLLLCRLLDRELAPLL